jgi:hypothetical protein
VIDRAHLDEYIAKKGPYLYHRAPAEALPLIARQGLLPWDHDERSDIPEDWEEGSTTTYADSRLTPRSNHVYVGDGGYVRRYDGITLRIDLRELALETLAGDEDHFDVSRREVPAEFAVHLTDVPREWGSTMDWVDPDCPDCEGAGAHDPADCPACEGTGKDLHGDPRDEESLGDWADGHRAIIDSPEAVAHSLASGSVAIRGTVPAAAIEIDPARLLAGDYETIARAFAGAELEVSPFPLEHEGRVLTVLADHQGNVLSPDASVYPERYALACQVAKARGQRVIELFNSGQLRLELPTLSGIDEPAPVSVSHSAPALGL